MADVGAVNLVRVHVANSEASDMQPCKSTATKL